MSTAVRLPRATRPTPGGVARAVLLAAVSLLASGGSVSAQTWFVDREHPAASDSGPGTEEQPYRTIVAALTAHKGAGVTIVVKPGVYREQVSVPASGAAGSPFTIRASGPGVMVDGSDDLSEEGLWDDTLDPVYRASSVTWSPKQVFVDGVRLAASTATPDELPAGSFVYVSGEGLYVNLGGDEPGDHDVRVSRRNYAFTMSNRSFVTVDGFEITRTNDRGINMHTCADLVISNNRVSFAGSYGIHAVNSQRVLIERNRSTDSEFHGIGLTAGSTACTVRDNESARNVHPVTRQGNGIYVYAAPANTIHGNDVHHNQDSGVYFTAGSNDCVSFNNRSWANEDHGYDHTQVTNTVHVHDVAYGNLRDGFSFEATAPGGQLHNCISVENGLTTNRFDLWVDANSVAGFVSDYNLFWNSTAQAPVRIAGTIHPTLASLQASGLDLHSVQSNPMFTSPANGDFTLLAGSPAIDGADSGVPFCPGTDAAGNAPADDPRTANAGAGPVLFADLGAYEHIPVDGAPVVVAPGQVRSLRGGRITFTVLVGDPDGDPIQSLVMNALQLPPGHAATFVPNADNTGGTFTWETGTAPPGSYLVEFVAANWATGASQTTIQIRTERSGPVPPETDPEPGGHAHLSRGFPNPSAGAVELSLSLAAGGVVEWGIFDAQGREIWSESRVEPAGLVRLVWSGRDTNGRAAPTGVYFARVKAAGSQAIRRIVRF